MEKDEGLSMDATFRRYDKRIQGRRHLRAGDGSGHFGLVLRLVASSHLYFIEQDDSLKVAAQQKMSCQSSKRGQAQRKHRQILLVTARLRLWALGLSPLSLHCANDSRVYVHRPKTSAEER